MAGPFALMRGLLGPRGRPLGQVMALARTNAARYVCSDRPFFTVAMRC
jgi:hypothetical protein